MAGLISGKGPKKDALARFVRASDIAVLILRFLVRT
jgi:hypothetical protein